MSEAYLASKVGPVLRPILKKAAEQRPADVRAFLLAELQKVVYEGSAFPWKPEHVNAEWLSTALNTTVDSFEIEKCGMGFTADAWRIKCQIRGGEKIYILKLPHSFGEAKQKMHQADCAIEVMFYRDFSQHVPYATCKHYAANLCPTYPWRWNLLLENLALDEMEEFPLWFGGDHTYPDIWTGVVPSILADVAKSHAMFYKSPLLEHEMFSMQPQIPGTSKVSFGMANTSLKTWERNYRNSGKNAGELFCSMICESPALSKVVGGCDAADLEYYKTLCKRLATEDGRRFYDYIMQQFDRSPHTFIHGDAHPGNIFRNTVTKDLTWIDFQLIGRAPPGVDLAQTMLFPCSSAKGSFERLIGGYYEELVAASSSSLDGNGNGNGHSKSNLAAEYSFEQCWLDFRMAMIVYQGGCGVYCIDNIVEADKDLVEKGQSDFVDAFIAAKAFPRVTANLRHIKAVELMDEILEKI